MDSATPARRGFFATPRRTGADFVDSVVVILRVRFFSRLAALAPPFASSASSRARLRLAYLPMSSQSNTHLVSKGSLSAALRSPSARNSFAPHCVSYTGTRSASDASVAKTRPT